MELFRGSLLRLEDGGKLEGWGFEKLIGGGFVWKGKHASFVREKRSPGKGEKSMHEIGFPFATMK